MFFLRSKQYSKDILFFNYVKHDYILFITYCMVVHKLDGAVKTLGGAEFTLGGAEGTLGGAEET